MLAQLLHMRARLLRWPSPQGGVSMISSPKSAALLQAIFDVRWHQTRPGWRKNGRFQVADRGDVRLRQARCFGKQICEGRVSPEHNWNHWKQPQGGPKTSRLDLQVTSHNKSILL